MEIRQTFANPAQNGCEEFMHVLIKHSCDIAVIWAEYKL